MQHVTVCDIGQGPKVYGYGATRDEAETMAHKRIRTYAGPRDMERRNLNTVSRTAAIRLGALRRVDVLDYCASHGPHIVTPTDPSTYDCTRCYPYPTV